MNHADTTASLAEVPLQVPHADCLRRLPEHWTRPKLGWLVQCLDGRRVPVNSEERGAMQGDIPYWGANGVLDHVDSWLFDEELVLLGEDGAPFFDSAKPVAFRVRGKLWVNNHAHVLRPGPQIDAGFLTYALNSIDYHAYIDGSTREKLTQGAMRAIPIQCPPLKEQHAVTDFLDHETEQIDSLVAQKQRLLELLLEQRTAVISRAVTKGLDAAVSLRDSGIGWLGRIPPHWSVLRLSRIVDPTRRVTYGIVQPGDPDPDGRFMVRGQDYSNGWAEQDAIFRVSPEIENPYARARLAAGDLVLTIVGAGVGNTAIVPERLAGANITQTTARVALNPSRALPDFVWFLMQSTVGAANVGLAVRGAAQPGLTLANVQAFTLPMPPVEEQAAIARHIHQGVATIDRLVESSRHIVGHLSEYRSALITAAVTGQIDVRTYRSEAS